MRTSYQVTAERTCVGCNEDTHPLHTCDVFQSLTPGERLAKENKHSLCHQGHFASHCQSTQRCMKCRGRHQTMLHLESKVEPEPTPKTKKERSEKPLINNVVSHFVNGRHGGVLLMTFQVLVRGRDGSTMLASALLGSGSETSFVTERLPQQLHLPQRRSPMVACLGGAA